MTLSDELDPGQDQVERPYQMSRLNVISFEGYHPDPQTNRLTHTPD